MYLCDYSRRYKGTKALLLFFAWLELYGSRLLSSGLEYKPPRYFSSPLPPYTHRKRHLRLFIVSRDKIHVESNTSALKWLYVLTRHRKGGRYRERYLPVAVCPHRKKTRTKTPIQAL